MLEFALTGRKRLFDVSTFRCYFSLYTLRKGASKVWLITKEGETCYETSCSEKDWWAAWECITKKCNVKIYPLWLDVSNKIIASPAEATRAWQIFRAEHDLIWAAVDAEYAALLPGYADELLNDAENKDV